MNRGSTEREKRDSEKIRRELEALIRNYESELKTDELRSKVLALIPIFHELRKLGKSLLPPEYASAARDRVLFYFLKYPGVVIHGDELLVVSAIQDYPRRLRELRVQYGWSIASGITIRDMADEDAEDIPETLRSMKPSDYILLVDQQDREAALRWRVANDIRKRKMAVREKILEFLRANTGHAVTGEELRYVAGDKTEWARRVRELRTEFGWPVVTKTTGRPDLAVGEYILEADRQTPAHDRKIPDDVRRQVLRSSGYRCEECKWSHELWNRSDPRHLELHHKKQHAHGGENEPDNLQVLCTLCHDEVHRKHK